MANRRISAGEAYNRIAKLNHFNAGKLICNRAADEVITARAAVLVLGTDRFEDVDLPAWFWWARGGTALIQNWQAGDFETWVNRTEHYRAYGVTFEEADIEAMLPERRLGRPVEQAPHGNFAPAQRCVAELAATVQCSSADAGRQIARHCRARLIDSRCANIRWEVKDRYGTEEFEMQNAAIPPWFWEHCADHPDAVLDWKSGNFAGRGSIDGETYVVSIRGAKFDVGGIVNLEAMLMPDPPPSPATERPSLTSEPAPQASTAGRPRSENWSNWIAELVDCIHVEGFPEGEDVEGQDELIARIDQRLIDRDVEGLGRSTVQPVIRAVLLRNRQAGNSED